MSEGIRRIVTGHNENGEAVVIQDGPTPNVKTSPNRPGVVMNHIWMTDKAPADIEGEADAGERIKGLEPPAGGTVFRVIEFPPEAEYMDKVSGEMAQAAFAEMGAGDALEGGEKPPHPFMHATKTVDYAICLEGEMVMIMDDSEVTMKAGDVMIQRGTNHAWANRGDKVCKMAFVLIDGE